MLNRVDTAGVIAPPPLIALVALLAGLALNWMLPVRFLSPAVPFAARAVIAAFFIAVGFGFIISANLAFRSAGTNVEPWKPSLVLVRKGAFGWLRNPMYVGGTIALLGIAAAVDSVWLVGTAIVSALVIHYGVVKREERYLESKFGDAFRDYCASVPRYGWPRR